MEGKAYLNSRVTRFTIEHVEASDGLRLWLHAAEQNTRTHEPPAATLVGSS